MVEKFGESVTKRLSGEGASDLEATTDEPASARPKSPLEVSRDTDALQTDVGTETQGDIEESLTPPSSKVGPSGSDLEAEFFTDNLVKDAEPSATSPISPGYGSQRSCGPAE